MMGLNSGFEVIGKANLMWKVEHGKWMGCLFVVYILYIHSAAKHAVVFF